MEPVPRITSATVIGKAQLLIRFENGMDKVYDCTPLLTKPQFRMLANPAFFNTVQVDTGGYGISWNDDIDLSEYELWTSGSAADTRF
jgi:hypothetical protein